MGAGSPEAVPIETVSGKAFERSSAAGEGAPVGASSSKALLFLEVLVVVAGGSAETSDAEGSWGTSSPELELVDSESELELEESEESEESESLLELASQSEGGGPEAAAGSLTPPGNDARTGSAFDDFAGAARESRWRRRRLR